MSADDFDFDLNTHIATIIVSTLFVLIFLLFFVFCITASIKNRHKNKLQRQIFNKTPVVVTSATHTAPGGYPVTQIPPPNTTYQTNVYAPPYPQQGTTMQMPMPMPVAQPPHQGMSGYPPMPMPMPQQQMNPPSYDAAVAGYSAGPPQPSYGAGQPQPQVMPYEKQSPYNPSFTAQ